MANRKAYNPAMAMAAYCLREAGFPVGAVARALRVSRLTAEKLCEYRHREEGHDAQSLIDTIRAVEMNDTSEPTILPDDPPQPEPKSTADEIYDRIVQAVIRSIVIIEKKLEGEPKIGEAIRAAKELAKLAPEARRLLAQVQDEDEAPQEPLELLEWCKEHRRRHQEEVRKLDEQIASLHRKINDIP